MKPIHKFNGGLGATLCHSCSKIISLGMTDDLYCEFCDMEVIGNKTRNEYLEYVIEKQGLISKGQWNISKKLKDA